MKNIVRMCCKACDRARSVSWISTLVLRVIIPYVAETCKNHGLALILFKEISVTRGRLS